MCGGGGCVCGGGGEVCVCVVYSNLSKQVIASKTTTIYLTAFHTTWTIKQPHILPLPIHTHHRN